MSRRQRGQAERGSRKKPYEGHESLTGYLQSLAYRAGISDSSFWSMTAHNVVVAFMAAEQSLTRLAWRTAYYGRVQHRHFPKNEDAIFASIGRRAAPERQTLRQQYAMARMITKVLH